MSADRAPDAGEGRRGEHAAGNAAGSPATGGSPAGSGPGNPGAETSGPDSARRGVKRRHLLFGGAAAGLGALAAAGAALSGGSAPAPDTGAETAGASAAGTADRAGITGAAVVPFYGPRQAGIETPAQAHAVFLALDLKPGLTRQRLAALLRLLSDDAAALTRGRPALADTEPELAVHPARLTVTFGFGPELLALAAPGLAPAWLRPLPAFGIDRLSPDYTGGDLLLQLCADDPLTLAHARRMLLKDSRAFTTLRWAQSGFLNAAGSGPAGATPRNLFGQLDGTGNPRKAEELDRVVWGGPDIRPWLENGTSVVIRRIAMNLDTWDELDRRGREESVGRTLDTGAPLTGTAEHDEPDFGARNSLGFPVIAESSHLRRARSDDEQQRIFRRSYNYDDAPGAAGSSGGISNSGQIFVSYQADVDRQFVPIQQRLDQLDILNEWTVPVGSAVFAVPPGAPEGGFVGEQLFS
ncbi:Dyp-type peroxidase [Arthrobacter sp. ATA002]|uniref:Dyp-type peroxidase n=1 Tax=Arthrobacter sp. ATA002 TaxID=2991715 RepID=UPI0022A74883|nr:Dyp-type peroxidase [Arthrobacter sp. ATA002]WAP52432.1 Dyp-type peroxidase [Arthrobacter sp. ATA002]